MGVAVELELILYPAAHPFGNSVCHSFASFFYRKSAAIGFPFFSVISVFFSTDSYIISILRVLSIVFHEVLQKSNYFTRFFYV